MSLLYFNLELTGHNCFGSLAKSVNVSVLEGANVTLTWAKRVSRLLLWFCLNSCPSETHRRVSFFIPSLSSSMQTSSRSSFFTPPVCCLWFLSQHDIGWWLLMVSQSCLSDLLLASVWWVRPPWDWLQLWLPVELWLSRCGGGTERARSKSRSLGQQVSEASTDIMVTKPLLTLLSTTQLLDRKC